MTDRVGQARQIDPKWAWVAVGVAALVGAGVIFASSSLIHRRDRLAVTTWERAAYSKVLRVGEIHASLTGIEKRIAAAPSATAGRGVAREKAQVQAARTEVQRIKRDLESLGTPEIMLTTAEKTFSAVGLTLESITWLEREIAAVPVPDDVREQFRAAWSRADDRFVEGRSALYRIRCRARVPNCETLPVV